MFAADAWTLLQKMPPPTLCVAALNQNVGVVYIRPGMVAEGAELNEHMRHRRGGSSRAGLGRGCAYMFLNIGASRAYVRVESRSPALTSVND